MSGEKLNNSFQWLTSQLHSLSLPPIIETSNSVGVDCTIDPSNRLTDETHKDILVMDTAIAYSKNIFCVETKVTLQYWTDTTLEFPQ